MITIIDYGMGNLGSIQNMLSRLGYSSIVASTPEQLSRASKIILPGVGSFDTGIKHLRESSLIPVLNCKANKEQVPILGICLGAQIMTRSSDEGHEDGLGWFNATTKKMSFDNISGKWPLPNIGWRDVECIKECALIDKADNDQRFYFVHSYYLCPDASSTDCSITTQYGFKYCCGLSRDNLYAVQFHPEKSHRYGMKFFANFANL